MKSLFLKLLLLLVAMQNSFGQYKKFAGVDGFMLSKGSVITSIATAGGGVVLIGIAKPKYPESIGVFTNVTFSETSYMSTMNIYTAQSKGSFSDSLWLLRDAAMLVASETHRELYRNVSLLGYYTDDELRNGINSKYERERYFLIEMSEPLVGTRSGQTLLYVDLILAGEYNTEYYGFNSDAVREYIRIKKYVDSVYVESVNSYYRSIGETAGWTEDDLIPGNYTYHDEFTQYVFSINRANGKLVVEGVPSYAFLDPVAVDSTSGEIEYEVNDYFTDFYASNFYLIKDLNKVVFTNAERFSQAAAFFRYLKKEYPQLWSRVVSHYQNTPRRMGDTPRFISKYPPSLTGGYE